jgi:hypothetical protein
MTMIRAKPWDVAKSLEEEPGLMVIAVRDGMTLNFLSMGSFACSTVTPQKRGTEKLEEGSSSEQLCAEVTW